MFIKYFLFLLSCFLLLLISCCNSTLISKICSSDVVNNNSTFHNNIDALLSSLSSEEAKTNGFYNTSVGDHPDQVYGLSLCLGSRSPKACSNCLDTIVDVVKDVCPDVKSAVFMDERCYVRYSNQSFFYFFDDSVMNFYRLPVNVSEPNQFLPFMKDMLAGLVEQAVSDTSGRLSATGKRNSTVFGDVYGLVQCTRDISRSDCGRCLKEGIQEFTKCCYYSKGLIMVRLNCFIRYEMYQFDLEPGSSAEGNRRKKLRAGMFSGVAALLALVTTAISSYSYYKRRRRLTTAVKMGKQENYDDFPSMDLPTIQEATNNFSFANKLGEGGFGSVYKGVMKDGKAVAVKRLSHSSCQGLLEFQNEVTLIAKLQHKNLVRLLGCCIEGEEKLLIYEFMPNTSLDGFLFGTRKQSQLDWPKRINIINGIARGLVYLHEDSRLKIIHRDLKASNVLLDHEMNPKISDFGMARIFDGDKTQTKTKRVVGTYGYMAPEYAMAGVFSIKSDVFSYGVLLLEIMTGKRNNSQQLPESSQSLLTYAWRLWCGGRGLELVDPTLEGSCSVEMSRCIHIGLLCVQADPADRPTMSTVVFMLGSKLVPLPQPKEPAFYVAFVASESDQSSSSTTKHVSINRVTITNMTPR